MSAARDPIAFELFKNAIFSLADEMALTVSRTSYSAVVKSGLDYSTSLADADGRMVAQGLTMPAHLGSMPTALGAVFRHFGNDIRPGDVYILNDPFDGGMHLPDIFLFKPIFVNGERIAFACTICHHTDVGGRVAGSNAADSTEIYQEGLRIPPLRYYEGGVRNEAVHKIIEKNVRVPVLVFGDLRAQLSACYTAEQGLDEFVRTYGADGVRRHMQEVIDYSERLTRAALRDLPDGVYDFVDWIDDDGVEFGKPIRLKVTFTKTGDRLAADWTGTAPQVRGAINNTLSFTSAATYCAVKSVLPGDIPTNEGFFRVVTVTAPEGTIANAVLPASSGARGITGFRMTDCALGALAKMCPDRVCAATDGGNVGVSLGGYYADRKPFIYVDFGCSAWGGRPFADGVEGNAHPFSNNSVSPVEMMEAESPLQLLAFEYVNDGAGAGKFRGGVPYRRDYRLLADEAVLQVRNDRRAVRPFGLRGGEPGQPSLNLLNFHSRPEPLTSKVTRTMRKGETFRYETAGGGGWGDPLERDPARVLKDVRNEFVSAESARERYGVVLDPERWTVDEAATAALRAALRARRGWTKPPFITRGPLPAGAIPED
ncbi:MAG: hydantoinase B/oxoprolinase family protein [Proteobacteria bacterium]|nr:hydantoinase B/oxoprolinase family protein [Pseudomonadota bacterium]